MGTLMLNAQDKERLKDVAIRIVLKAFVALALFFGIMYKTSDHNSIAISQNTSRIHEVQADVQKLDDKKADKYEVDHIRSDVDKIMGDYYVPRK